MNAECLRSASKRAFFLIAAAAFAAGCEDPPPGCIDVRKRMDLVARPIYSEFRVIGQLSSGRHRYTTIKSDGQYLWYEITTDGASVKGYLIVDPAVVRVDCSSSFGQQTKHPPTIPWATE